ncbi:Sec-independent protein translocase protein TatB [Sphingosinicella rhizophila]|uniref:Sec-independent protein translocase protein TatB n=1 Tax=Sphingosinicella rhizophila TaxID=3050082 RepID=A0ABU3Q3R1_9SPHN|nr:Sec-independent protein translocase protein TatB [Sphingosinicella sp. GR2756]MDT9598058.1 Sec-independent protein translocase protein TatB [Sphingosinicella sp. GR2756]
MFDIGYSELLIIGIVALVVIGPKDLPRVMRTVGNWVGRARGMARHFRSGLDTMMREAELEEMERKWREENERIMRDHPAPSASEDRPADPELPSIAPPVAEAPSAADAPPSGELPLSGGGDRPRELP